MCVCVRARARLHGRNPCSLWKLFKPLFRDGAYKADVSAFTEGSSCVVMRAASQTWIMLFDSWFWDFLVFLKQLRSYYPWCKVGESKFTPTYQRFNVCSHFWVARAPLSQEQRTAWLEGITSVCSALATALSQAWNHGVCALSPKEIILPVTHGHWHTLGNPPITSLTTEHLAQMTALPGV